ncbi:hypothetical protein Rvan_0847 [Rhodomicrobium vannielii ATCC 17100]|uniref:Uncharacterized protein n=1 Tax=Rhodomicrobium vannielii (strain ATCC 17100 / DSM 162 / LMG 4299 / NCIMB 10020 / ATH 3.1.1) TaxID=648757 RepID=E3I1B0_RHOVT|nr:hypothetical protein Rvan_0847 [Rhodomicrobium vannielii ATCC 17100]
MRLIAIPSAGDYLFVGMNASNPRETAPRHVAAVRPERKNCQ